MNITVTNIIQTKPVYQPNGKTYKLYGWTIEGVVEGQSAPEVLEVKAFKQMTLETGVTIEVEKQEYMGKITWRIIGIRKMQNREAKTHSTTSRVSYTLDEYNDLFLYAWSMFEPRLAKIPDPAQRIECLQKLISTYIISAVQNGIKIPHNQDYTATQSNNRQKLLYNQGVA